MGTLTMLRRATSRSKPYRRLLQPGVSQPRTRRQLGLRKVPGYPKPFCCSGSRPVDPGRNHGPSRPHSELSSSGCSRLKFEAMKRANLPHRNLLRRASPLLNMHRPPRQVSLRRLLIPGKSPLPRRHMSSEPRHPHPPNAQPTLRLRRRTRHECGGRHLRWRHRECRHHRYGMHLHRCCDQLLAAGLALLTARRRRIRQTKAGREISGLLPRCPF